MVDCARKTCLKLAELELKILERGNEMSSKEASIFYDDVISCYKEFLKYPWSPSQWTAYDYLKFYSDARDIVQKKVIHLEKILLRFFSPAFTISSAKSSCKVDDRQVTSRSELSSLLRKQGFFIKMIDSLEPTDHLNSIEAEVKSKHLDQFHEKFVSNQSDVITLVNDASLDEQIEISQKVLQKVLTFQTKLKEIISPIKTVTPALNRSSMNEHFNQTERPRVIADFLDSQMKKQKSLIEQIELIESKNDPSTVEAETLHGHLSQLHDTFVKNQSKIENYVSGPALDEQLRISGEILQKVITLQTKLKEISAPIASQAKDGSVGEAQPKLSFSFGYLEWLRERQTALKNEIDDVIRSRGCCGDAPKEVEQLYEWFNLYQSKIELLVGESPCPYDFKNAKENFDEVRNKLENYRCNVKMYTERLAAATHAQAQRMAFPR